MDTLAKFMLRADYPIGALIWARYAVHLIVTVALLWPRMGSKLFRAKRPGLQLTRGLLLVASTLCFYSALSIPAAGRSCRNQLRRPGDDDAARRLAAARARKRVLRPDITGNYLACDGANDARVTPGGERRHHP